MFKRVYTSAERARRVKQQYPDKSNVLLSRHVQIILKNEFKLCCSTHMNKDDNLVLLHSWVEKVVAKFDTLPLIDHFRCVKIAISQLHDETKPEYLTWRSLKIFIEKNTLFKFHLPLVPKLIDRPVIPKQDFTRILQTVAPEYYPVDPYENDDLSATDDSVDSEPYSQQPSVTTMSEPLSDMQQQQKDFRYFEADDHEELMTRARKWWDRISVSKKQVSFIRNDIVQPHSFNGLKPGNKLNDEVIQFYMKMLNNREKKKLVKKSYFFSPFFISKLLFGEHNGYDFDSAKKWTKRICVMEFDKLFFPIFIAQCHWTLAVIYVHEQKIEYYDSMNGLGATNLMNGLLRWLRDECNRIKYEKPQSFFDLTNWSLINKNPRHIPQQNNGIDCGLYVIMNADFLSDDVPITRDTYNFSDMLYFRNKIAVDILRKSLKYQIAINASGNSDD